MSDVTISYEVTEADVIRAYEYFYRTSPTDRRLGIAARVGFPIFCAAFFAYVKRGDPHVLLGAGIAFVVSALVVVFGGPLYNRMVWRARFRGRKEPAEGPTRLTLEAAGIRVASALGEGLLRWPAIGRIDADGACVYFLSGSSVLAVPTRAFAATNEVQEFVRRARELKQASTARSD